MRVIHLVAVGIITIGIISITTIPTTQDNLQVLRERMSIADRYGKLREAVQAAQTVYLQLDGKESTSFDISTAYKNLALSIQRLNLFLKALDPRQDASVLSDSLSDRLRSNVLEMTRLNTQYRETKKLDEVKLVEVVLASNDALTDISIRLDELDRIVIKSMKKI